MSKSKIILLTSLVAVVMVVSIFLIYNINNDKENNLNNNINSSSEGNNSKTKQQETVIVDNNFIEKKISISQRCRGCGKCAMMDPEHFVVNQTTRKAEVVSQENLSSTNLARAISMCPESAITIN